MEIQKSFSSPLPDVCEQPQDKKSASEMLRLRLLHGHSLSTTEQTRLREEINSRSTAIGLFGNRPLFHFSTAMLPGVNRLGEQNFAYIAKPGHLAKLILADLYRKKYGIVIHVQKHAIENTARFTDLLLKKLVAAKGGPVGMILQPNKLSHLQNQFTHSKEMDFLDHVSPVIVQGTAQGLDVIDLDSLEPLNLMLQDTLQALKKQGHQVRRMELDFPERQSDKYSCHTDAVQILKDALVEHKNSKGNLYDRFWQQHGVESFTPSEGDYIDPYPIELPPHLHKVTQRSKAMVSNRMARDELLATRAPSDNPEKVQTVGEHRQRFSFTTADSKHTINNFLVLKAYRNALKVLDQLSRFSNANERAQYIHNIQEIHGLD